MSRFLTRVLIGLLALSQAMPLPAYANAVIFNGNDVKALKPNLDLNGGPKILSGTVDPTAVATTGNPGSLYLNTSNGKVYRKKDSGSSTNWTSLGSGGGGLFQPGQNLIVNSSWEDDTAGWTATGGAYARVTAAANIIPPGVGAASWDPSAAGQALKTDAVTIVSEDGLSGRNGVLSCAVKTAATDLKLQVYDGANVISPDKATDVVPASPSGFRRYSVNFIFPRSGTLSARFYSQSDSAIAYIDDCFWGLAEGFNLMQVSQASLYGAVKITGCSTNWTNSAAGSWSNFSIVTGCAYSARGNASAPASNVPGITFASLPPGEYLIVATGVPYATITGGNAARFRFSDGTNSTPQQWIWSGLAGSYNVSGQTLTGSLTVSSAQGSTTIQVQSNPDSGTTAGLASAGLDIMVYRFPLTSELAYRPEQLPVAPTVTKYTTGSGTYTVPSGVKALRVRMVGGGGGGAGSGSANGTAAGAGGDSTFGSSLLIAGGGSAGTRNGSGAAGGTASIGLGAVGSAIAGGQGGASSGQGGGTPTAALPGGQGGSSALGGAGSGGSEGGSNSGIAGAANTGGGGGGGLCSSTTAVKGGAGGGAGGFVEAWIGNPLPSYAYSVGAAGTAGGAGTGGYAGGAGGSGLIEITEFYNAVNVPYFVASVTSDSTGQERIERAVVSATCSSSPCALASASAGISSITRTGTGGYTINFSPPYSNLPSCTPAPGGAVDSLIATGAITNSAFSFSVLSRSAGTATDNRFNVLCMGPR